MKTLEEVAKTLDPDDGFTVRDLVVGNEHTLVVGYKEHDHWIPLLADQAYLEVWGPNSHMMAESYGKKQRTLELMRAVCRFLNTGGDIAQMVYVGDILNDVLKAGFDRRPVPVGNLINTTQNTEGVYEHLFHQPGEQNVLRWVEGEFVDTVSTQQLQREMEDAGSAAEEFTRYAIDDTLRALGPTGGELRDRDDPAAAPPDAGDSPPEVRE